MVEWHHQLVMDPMDMSLSKLQMIVKDREAWCATVLSDMTETLNNKSSIHSYPNLHYFAC